MYSSFLDLLLIKSDFILLLFGIISLLSKLRANFLPAYLLLFLFHVILMSMQMDM